MKNATLAVLTAASIFVAASTAAAQTVRGTLQGLVVDGTGGVVAGAQVIVTSDATGARQSVRTDDRGWFVVTPIDPGTYKLEVTHTGFRKHLQSFTLQVNQRLRLDVVLQPGQVTETVTVVAPAAVDRTATSLSSRFDPDRIANLPLDGRNFLDLALLTLGAAPAAQGSAGSVRGDFAFNVNGAREDVEHVPARRRAQLRSEAELRGRASAGRRHPGIRGDRQHAGCRASAAAPGRR